VAFLTKSSFLRGRQCARRLWLSRHRPPEPAVESEDVWVLREAEGAEVERAAATLFRDVLRIAAAEERESDAEARTDVATLARATRSALVQRRPILQAYMCTDGLLAIADVLEPRGDGWYLLEVKASTTHKPIFDWDLAFQVEVARLLGIRVDGAGVLRLNGEYIRGASLDATRLLVREDRSEAVAHLEGEVRDAIEEQWTTLRRAEVPAALPGRHCTGHTKDAGGRRPSDCGHLGARGYCGAQLPEDWVGRLPRLSERKVDALMRMTRPAIGDLDPDDPSAEWTPKQRRMIHAVQSGTAQVDAGALRIKLEEIHWPVAYVDFEFDPGMAVPRFEGTWPYARIPFQWSMHIQRAPGAALEQPAPFLHLDETDPRAKFLESLLSALPLTGSVVVHSRTAEQAVLQQLADSLGGASAVAARDVIGRLFDTLELLQAGYYHPTQHGSYSIKTVAPILLGRGYDDLELQDGLAAVIAWKRACRSTLGTAERRSLERQLTLYCGRDTELLHEILEAARELVAAAGR
jgi:hypothetical protein